MFKSISSEVVKIAKEIEVVKGLDDEDIRSLRDDGPRLVKLIKSYIETGKDPLAKLNEDQKRLLLAYVIYTRQNLNAGPGDNPNDEDAAQVLHGDVYNISDAKKRNKEITKDLKKQLAKAGFNIDKKEER